LTQIKFNAEGDLLFSCSKDHIINVWFSHNGERLGTYDGHNGTVWTVDVDCEHSFAGLFLFSSKCPRYADHESSSTIAVHGIRFRRQYAPSMVSVHWEMLIYLGVSNGREKSSIQRRRFADRLHNGTTDGIPIYHPSPQYKLGR
jgi:hypothetical protein